MSFMNGVEKGRRGEDLAAAFLLDHGYRLLYRNWRVKMGEIDIIAEREGTLVFCEVKTRSSTRFGTGAEAVNQLKQRKIIQTAAVFLQLFASANRICQFDVIEITTDWQGNCSINHIRNAFSG